MDNSAIIKRIEMRLAELGMSKADFYQKSGITSASYSQWNTGKYRPSEAKLRCVAACLDLSYEYLYLGVHPEITKAPAVTRRSRTDDAKAAFFDGYGDNLSEEEKDELWEDARVYAKFKAQQKK